MTTTFRTGDARVPVPTTFVDDAPRLFEMLVDRGHSARMVWVTVADAPVWHLGDIVARVSGEYPAGYSVFGPDGPPVVLLDNGVLSILATWRIESERD